MAHEPLEAVQEGDSEGPLASPASAAALPATLGAVAEDEEEDDQDRNAASTTAATATAAGRGPSSAPPAASASILSNMPPPPSRPSQQPAGPHWVWRTPLEKSQPAWEGWYRGLSEEFLKASVFVCLCSAGAWNLGALQGCTLFAETWLACYSPPSLSPAYENTPSPPPPAPPIR